MNKEITLFIASLIAPLIYWRVFFFFRKSYFYKPFLRTKTGLQIHHLHHGIFLVFLASIIFLLTGNRNLVIVFLGLGLGLILDELIFTLLAPANRPMELEIYQRSFRPTLILFLVIILGIAIISLIL